MKIGILFSGGLESTSLLLHYEKLNYQIELLYIKFGFLWEVAELSHIERKFSQEYKIHILDLSHVLSTKQLGFVDSVEKNIIPNRNLLMLSNASTYFYNMNIFKIAIGLQGGLEYPDTSLEYLNSLKNLIQIGLQEPSFEIDLPFFGLDKDEIVTLYDSLDLNEVFSCTNPVGIDRCHECFKCKKLDKIKNKK